MKKKFIGKYMMALVPLWLLWTGPATTKKIKETSPLRISMQQSMEYDDVYPEHKEENSFKEAKTDNSALLLEKDAVWPVDRSDGGCKNKGCKAYHTWMKRINTLTVALEDLMEDFRNLMFKMFDYLSEKISTTQFTN
ncbi:MAG: hypothetical protein LBH77_00680 [Tannerella sp.]|jgi:hypothetical protein|nr:hypothetical protein [Tannerella sp.]